MSNSTDRAREELIRARILCDIANMAEANRRARLLPSPERPSPEKPLPDVPLHKRGFGVMDEDAP
jgi:hypothetical protein